MKSNRINFEYTEGDTIEQSLGLTEDEMSAFLLKYEDFMDTFVRKVVKEESVFLQDLYNAVHDRFEPKEVELLIAHFSGGFISYLAGDIVQRAGDEALSEFLNFVTGEEGDEDIPQMPGPPLPN